MLRLLSLFCVVFLFCLNAQAAAKRSYVCVFDPVGRSGDVFTIAQDMVTDFLSLGVELKLYPYKTESLAIQDFKAGLCDAIVITGMRAQEFNKFTSSIESIGSIHGYKDLLTILNALNQPKAAKLFTQGPYEVVSIFPAGAIYVFMSDKTIRTRNDMKDKRMIVMHEDNVTPYMVRELGAQPVYGDTSNFSSKFKRGDVDIVFSPAVVYEPFELEKGIEKSGGILAQPVSQLTLQIIVRKKQFPADFGQKARQMVALNWYDRAMNLIESSEAKIDKKYWINISNDEKEELNRVLRNARIKMTKAGVYHPKMLRLLRKVRCKSTPKAQECTNPIE